MVHHFTKEEALNQSREANLKLKLQTEQYKAETERLAITQGSGPGSGTPAAAATGPKGERRTPLTRPSVNDDCTESDWSFFLASWGRYVNACKLEGMEVTCHLWSTCSESLQKALHN